MQIHTPDWVKNAVFYQIFPDRFARSPRMVHSPGIEFKPWGSPPEEQGYQGGDLFGIVDKLDYLKDLGITAIYLNPIFSAATNHRYNAYDFLEVDPLLGGKPALRELLDEAHRRGIKIVLDGVFNHCGRGFWAFHHILENGGLSPYIDWFTVTGWPLNAYPDSNRKKANYANWWGNHSLPKFNTDNPGVRAYIFQVARYWLEFGIDGWRLDVPEEIQDDSFWREFRQIVKSVNPEAYIVGEIWHEARHWLQGDMFDAVMNYQITGPVLNFFGSRSLNMSWKHNDVVLGPIDAAQFAARMNDVHALYDWEIILTQMNMLDSHDMPRALWLVGNDKLAYRLAVLCALTLPGAPNVYYGDEIGLSAAGDPHCRQAFPWDQPESWDLALRQDMRAAIALRHATPALRTGDFEFVLAEESLVVYRRRFQGQEVLVAFNAGMLDAQICVAASYLGYPAYQHAWQLGGVGQVQVEGGNLAFDLSAQQAAVLVAGTAV